MTDMPEIDTVLPEADLMARIEDLADRLAPRLTGEWSAINILVGATPFTSDLMKALARRDLHPVLDTGKTLAFARSHMLAKGAREVITCALARKPWAPEGEDNVDFHAFDAPPRFLVGYGMDDAGKYRGLPFIGALD